jgi:hypothetical protein
MNDESNAWRKLEQRAAEQLRGDFASRVMRVSRGPSDAAWRELGEVAADQLRLGFADRVMRAVRVRMPSLAGQFAFGAMVAAACVAAVIILHRRESSRIEAQNLAKWESFMADDQVMALRQ